MIDHLDQLKRMPKSIPSRKYKGKKCSFNSETKFT